MNPFTSDHELRRLQRRIAAQRHEGPDAVAARREAIEDEREVRNHKRWQILVWAIVGPSVGALAYALVYALLTFTVGRR